MTCEICPHGCKLNVGQAGACKARKHTGSQIECINYGQITSLALDPIEKKPLYHFHPGSKILSVGSYGCNLACPFCQNHSISMAAPTPTEQPDIIQLLPYELVEEARKCIPMGNIGLAFTYNEPTISYEYLMDCAPLCHKYDMKNVLVTNGFVQETPLLKLLPHIDAMNIDLKGFTDTFYKKVRGDLNVVKQTIQTAFEYCHVEVTTLVIPGENDTVEEIRSLAQWLSGISPDIPLHLSRFFPCYQYSEKKATDVDLIYRLAEEAQNYLQYVYPGNC